jgi:asparagine synthase (glutamine-hydrolysing)
VAVIADARLDNRDILLPRFPDCSIETTDAELILRAVETWGLEAPAKLMGDFAFIAWDPREHTVVCARDSSGERPLFYRITAQTFAAGSDIHQLLQDPSVPIAPNEQRLRDFLVPYRVYHNDQEQPTTFFQGIFALPAGHVMSVSRTHESLKPYWALRPPREIRYRDEQQYVQHFADILVASLRSRMRSARPIGAMLSGGLDSTSVASLAQFLMELDGKDPATFTTVSMVFPGLECDESSMIREVNARYRSQVRQVSAADRVLNLDFSPAGFMAAPRKSPSEIDVLLAEASEAGVRLLLSGFLGDNCFGWSQRFFDSLLRRGRLGEFWRHLHAYQRTSEESLRKTLALYALVPLLPLAPQRRLRMAHVRRELRRQPAGLVPAWVLPQLADDLLNQHLELALDAERTRQFSGTEREGIFQSLYPPEVVPSSNAYPVQLVRPFGDRRLHEFILAIPPEQLYEPHPYAYQFYAGAKLILRRAMRGILPEPVRTQTIKPHFTAIVVGELQRRWADYAEAFGPGGRSEVAARGIVDPRAFWTRLQQLREGDFGPDGVYLTRVLNLESWLRTFRLPRPEHVTMATPSHPRIGHDASRAAIRSPVAVGGA